MLVIKKLDELRSQFGDAGGALPYSKGLSLKVSEPEILSYN